MRQIPLILATLLALYVAAWHIYASILQHQAKILWADQRGWGVALSAPPPHVHGFPSAFTLSWAGSIRTPEAHIIVPRLDVSLSPLPLAPLTLDFPHGFIGIPTDPRQTSIRFTRLALSFEVPSTLPHAWTKEEVEKLQAANVAYRLLSIRGEGPLTPGSSPQFSGHGELTFDGDLQPQGTLDLTIDNPGLIRDMLVTGTTSPLGKSFAKTAVNALMRTDPATGAVTLPITFRLEKQRLYAGPIQVGYVAHIYWPTETIAEAAAATPPASTTPPGDANARPQTSPSPAPPATYPPPSPY